jgi:hypothetical protein
MKRHLLLIPMLLLLISTQARTFSPQVTPMVTDEANEIITDIISVLGLKANFELKPTTDIPNAAAIIFNGKRCIAYNPEFITKLNAAAGNKWASVSVLSHEIGHHLNGHTLKNTGSQPAQELEADEFSGFVLQKMGATLSQAQAAMKLAADYRPTHTHPGQHDRLLAIQKGWNHAGGALTDMTKYNKPVSPVIPREEYDNLAAGQPATRAQSILSDRKYPADDNSAVLDSRYILATVDFPSDRTGNYYITTRFNVVKVMKGQLYILGKMVRTNDETYPFVLKSDQKDTLYINRDGKIVTANNELAGYLKI